MRTIASIAFLLITGLAVAASNPPTPAPAEATGKPKSNTAQVNQGAKASDNVTKSFSPIVKVPKPSIIDISAEEKAEKGSGYSSSEWWMVYLTAALAFITAWLAYYTARLYRATRTMVERSDAAAKWQYITTHRPRLIVRRVSLDDGNGDSSSSSDNIPKIQFIVANVGGSCARIIESNATFAEIDGILPAIPPYSIELDTIKSIVREAGQSDPPETLIIEGDKLRGLVRNWNKKFITNSENSQLYFFGYIQYRDDVDIIRRMTFCRQYNARTKRFTEVNDPEYEYSD